MLLTEGMIIPIRARGAGRNLACCSGSTAVTVGMIISCAVTDNLTSKP